MALMARKPRRVNKNRAQVSLKPSRVAKLEQVRLNPLLLGGKKQTPGGVLGLLVEAAWPLFERCDFDPMKVAAEADPEGKGRKTMAS